MWCHIFVIALILPGFLFADITTPHRICNDSSVTETGDKFFKCFGDTVKHSIDASHGDCKSEIENSMVSYVQAANATCYKDKTGLRRDSKEFYNLMDYSLRHDAFKDFVQSDGAKCIAAVKVNISECIKDTVGVMRGADDKYHTLWRKSHLYFQEKSCNDAAELKKCTLKAIREGCVMDSINISLYVNTLFEYMLEYCARLVRPDENTLNNPAPSPQKHGAPILPPSSSNSNVLPGVILALILVFMLYVLIRDYRNSRKHWEPETIAMTSQNTSSLVHNEGR